MTIKYPALNLAEHEGKPIIGCFPLYPPVELLYAMGLSPVVLWGFRGPIQQSDRHLQIYTCSVARYLIEWVLSDQGAGIAGILAYNACDSLRNLPEILQAGLREQDHNLSVFTFHLPQTAPDAPHWGDFLRGEINMLISRLEDQYGVTISPDQFRASVEVFREQRGLVQELEQAVGTGALSFGGFTRIVTENQFSPVEIQVENFEVAVHEVASTAPLRTEGPDYSRTIVSGILPPPLVLADAIEDAGFWVVGNDIAYLSRSHRPIPNEADTTDVGGFYDEFYRNHVPCSTLLYAANRRVDYLCQLAKERGAQSVIFLAEKYCECENFEFPFLHRALADKGIDSLILEVGVGDEENIAAFQNRIEAFWETIVGKNKPGRN